MSKILQKKWRYDLMVVYIFTKKHWKLKYMLSGDRVFIVYDFDTLWTAFGHVIDETETQILLRSTSNVPQQKSQVRRWKRVA